MKGNSRNIFQELKHALDMLKDGSEYVYIKKSDLTGLLEEYNKKKEAPNENERN